MQQPKEIESGAASHEPTKTDPLAPDTVPDGVSPPVRHPLDPLIADEINLATRLLQNFPSFESHMFITMMVPIEPDDKNYVINYKPNEPLRRRVTVHIRDPQQYITYEAIIDLIEKRVEKMIKHSNNQPSYTRAELTIVEKALRADKAIEMALAKRNLTMDDVFFYPFSPGHRDERDSAAKRRIIRPYVAMRKSPTDNYYAHHIDGLVITINIELLTVEIEDHDVVPIPRYSANYDPEGIKSPDNIPYFPDGIRKDLKPLVITQPDGPSFQIDGNQITWQKWRFRVGFNVRESLIIHMVEYFDQQRWRSIFYRAAIDEIWVPYGDANPSHNFKNVFDVGEVGIGKLVNSLVLGCDCLGEIQYLDATIHDEQGEALLLKNAICIHEEDAGLLWKHTEYIPHRTEVRRSRRLVVSCMTTVGNYEYGFFWYFQQDGAIHFEVKLTGIIAPGAIRPGNIPVSGGLVAEGLYGPHHQHFFNMRINWMVDGPNNSLVEVNCEPIQPGPENLSGNGWTARETTLSTVGEARRLHDASKGRFWKVINPNMKNHVNLPVAYKIVSMTPACHPMCQLESAQGVRSAMTRHHLWATRYNAAELYAAGLFPAQARGNEDGIAIYSEKHKDESLVECDLVTWYTFGCNHVVRPEDWPVMPVETVGFRLLPLGFFIGSPAIDVAPPTLKTCNGTACTK